MQTFPPPAPECEDHGTTRCMGFVTASGWSCQWPGDALPPKPCQDCGYPHTQPAGACSLCPECGSSSGCS